MSPGKGADAGAWAEAQEALGEGKAAAWFVERAGVSKAARKGVAAALGGEAAAAVRAELAAIVGEDGPVEKLLRRAAGRDVAAQVRKNPIARNEAFGCGHCGFEVPPAPGSSVRNHCPRCLHSRHVDGDVPGDRTSDCGGLMAPRRSGTRHGSYRVLQVCSRCGHERWNQLHPDWSVEPDQLDALPRSSP